MISNDIIHLNVKKSDKALLVTVKLSEKIIKNNIY
jgi:hypothetical protein